MRKTVLIGMLVSAIAIVGCSKKTEERANEGMMEPGSSSQEAAPAPMQDMDSMGKHDESSSDESQGGMKPEDDQAPAAGE